MSGLAAAFRDMGYKITGSDRGAKNPENAHIIQPLQNIGVEIFPQDGSYIKAGTPDALVFSSAIEEDNPDFLAGKGIKRLHRSEVLAQLISAAAGNTKPEMQQDISKATDKKHAKTRLSVFLIFVFSSLMYQKKLVLSPPILGYNNTFYYR